MGYLDDLRKKSGSKKAVEEQQRIDREKREAFYKKFIIPALKTLYGYLNEVVEHLNYLDHEVFVNYSLGSLGRLKDLKQSDYSLYVDSRQKMTQIMLKFSCAKEGPKKINVEGEKNVSRVSDYLKTTSLTFQQKNVYDSVHTVVSADFIIKSTVHVGFEFTADIDNSCIALKVRNFEAFGFKERRLDVKDVKSEFMDHLARYITHQVDDFFSLDMKDSLKAELQKNLQTEKLSRAQELKDMEELNTAEEIKKAKENKAGNPMFQVLNKFKKD